MKELKIFDEVGDLINALAEAISVAAEFAIEVNGRFNFVLSGGSSPKKLYELLASDSFRNRIDWDKTYFFFGDERFVPAEDSQRNSVMVKEALFEPLKIKGDHIFEFDTSGSPEESAENYCETIAKHFNGKPIEFDFILLGLGDNSHTASLFPNTSVLNETEAIIKSVFVEEVNMYRITMTAPLINQAKNIVFLVFGEGKSEAVFHILEDKSGSANEYPARLIKSEGKVEWFMDNEAAGKL
ncbi:6-phosphogluconolactonase [Halpernia sp. GG3]